MDNQKRQEIARLAEIKRRIDGKLNESRVLNAPKEESEQGFFGDSVDALQHGFLSGVADLADGARYLTGSETAGKGADFFRKQANNQIDQMSASGREAFQNFGVEDNDASVLGYGFKEGSNLKGFGLNFISGLGSFAPTMVPGAIAAKGVSVAGKAAASAGAGAGTRVGGAIEKASDVVGFGSVGAVAIGGSTANQAYETVANADFNILKDAEIFQNRYWELRDTKELDHPAALEQARESVARELATEAAKDGAIMGAITQGALGPVMGKLFRGEAGGIGKAAAIGAVTEGAQELVEGGAQTAISNVNVNPAVPTNTMDNVIGDALTGGLVGAPVGGTFGGVSGAFNKGDRKTENPDEGPDFNTADQSYEGIERELAEVEAFLIDNGDSLSEAEFAELEARRNELLQRRAEITGEEVESYSGPIKPSQTQEEQLALPNQNIIYGEKPESNARPARSNGLTDPYTGPQPSRKNDDPVYQEIKRKQQLLQQQEQEAKRLRDDSKRRQQAEKQQSQQVQLDGLESKTEIKAAKGNTTKAYTPSNQPVDLQYHIVDANDLVTSNNEDLSPNPSYPQALQNRDRTTDSSRDQINRMANGLIPEKLIESADVSTGAPIVRNGVVESGNGRTLAIRKAYSEGKAGNYKSYLEQNAERFGINPDELTQFENPVLVRQRQTEMTPEELTAYTKDANTSEGQSLKPSEQARSDAQRIQREDLDLINLPESGDVAAPSNKAFVGKFLGKLSSNERAGLVGKDGTLTQQGATRIQNAIFAKAYQSNDLVDEATDATTSDIKGITNALAMAATEYAKLDGGVPDLTNTIVDAVSLIKKSRRDNVSVQELTNQFDIERGAPVDVATAQLANFLDSNIRSAKRMSEGLSELATQAYSALQNAQTEGLFGAAPQPTAEGLINANEQIRSKQSGTQGNGPQTDAQNAGNRDGQGQQEQQVSGRATASGTGGMAQRDGAGRLEQEPRLSKSGKPFKTQASARLSQTFKTTPNAEIVPVEGGFGVREGQAADQPIQQTTDTQPTQQAEPLTPNAGIIEHTTKKGKVLRGVVRTDLSQAEAKEIDPYTFKKDGGYFIREDKLPANEKPVNNTTSKQPPDAGFELTGQTEESRAQEEAEQRASQEAESRRRSEAEQRAKADSEANNFDLTGSDRPADIAAAGGQIDLLGANGTKADTKPQPEAKKAEPTSTPKNKLDSAADTISAAKREKAEKLAALLKRRRGQLNSGIDPEVMIAVAEVGALSIAEGAIKFAQFVRDTLKTTRAVGIEDSDVKPFLKEAYGAISANPEKYDVTDDMADQMDTPRDIRKQNLDDIISKMDSEQGSLSDFLGARLDDITNNNKLKAAIAEYDNVSTKDIDNERLKDGQESLEKALVIRARQIVEEGKGDKATFDSLVNLYKNQPNLDVRSSTSMENQAYSTPAPLAFAVSRLAGIDQSTTVYEPTAGNGMLLIGANKNNATLNELNDLRADQLQEQGFKVTRNDAVEYVPSKKVDSVIMNPPFAKIDRTTYDGYVLKALDHAIVAKALEAMKDDGKASIIIGASRNDGEIKPADRTFFNWLYSTYNVTDHFEVSGDLYSRQGASWPVRVITVSGRVQSDTLSPKSGTIERVTTWDQVYDRFMESLETSQRQPEQAKRPNVDSNERTQDDQASAGTPRIQATQPNQTVEGGERGGSGARRAASDTGRRGDDAARGNAQSGSVSSGAGKSKPDADGGRRPDAKGETGPQRQSEAERNDAGGVGRGRTDSDQRVSKETKSEPKAKDQKDTTDASEYQKEYETFSGGSNEAVLTPENMAEASSRSLQKIADSVGGIDQYVMEKLGYDNLDQLHKSFMGLQVDTVAAAIYNAENKGRGIIIADQTGVGKGRQAAGIIRYALKEGKVPIFITVKDNLFTDMYNDLKDIGSNDVSPLIMNIDAGITENGNKIFKNKPKDHRKILENIAKTGELPKGSNALFLTYSQINKENTQRQVIDALKDKAFFVLDESHNAAGNRSTVVKGAEKLSTAGFIYQAIENAPVTYLSATYAKRPDNLPVYYRTDIVDAVDNIDELSDAIQAGGETLQTIIAGMLAESGQLYRRERSFKGIEINTKIDKKNSAKHTEVADNITIGIRSIVEADRLFHEIGVKAISENLAAQGATASGAGNKASSSVNHTNFTSIVHNFISQMLLGLKVERTVEEAIAAHKRGEKPVIALQNTMGSFLTEYITDNNLREGDPIDANYKDVLQRALDRTRRITIKNKMGQDDTVTVELKDLDPVVRYAYKEAQDVIDGLDIESMPISPIDYVRGKLEQAGIRTSEITGRKNTIDYSGRVPRVGKRDAKEAADKRSVVDGFNKGDIDALVVNVAGATGLSIHSSAKFNDTKPRHMIIMQAMGDINIFMQMIGRINRTGQVNLPIYTNLGLDIPAEKRPLAKTSRKMKSLNANTSANTESDTSLDVADILNKYGDQVVSDYLKENPSVAVETGLSVEATAWGLAEKFTGRMALLPVKRQTEIYAEIEAEYADLIDYLNKVGQNDLVPTKLDMQAKVEETIVIYEGKDPSSTFGGNTYLHRVDAKYQGKPPTAREVSDALDKAPDGDEIIAQITQNKEADNYLNKFDQESESAFSENKAYVAKVLTELGYNPSTSMGEAIDKAEAAGNRAAVKKLKAALKKSEGTAEKYSDIKRNKLIDLMKKNKMMLQRFKIGNHVLLEVDGEVALAVVTNVRDSHKRGNGNPWSLSKTKVTFMLDSGIRQIDLPLSKLDLDDGIYIESKKTKGKEQLETLFDKAELIENRRERRFVATGNLIKGSAELSGKGRIVSFTMANGDVAQGILLTRKFKDAEFTGMKKNATFAVREPKKISQMLRSDAKISVFTSDKSIKVEKEGMRWAVIVPKANKTSEVKAVKFDKELRKIIGSDFYGKGQAMKALVDESKLDATIGRLSDIVTLNADPQSREAWVRAGGNPAPKAEDAKMDGAKKDQPNLSVKDKPTGSMKAEDIHKAMDPLIKQLNEEGTFEVVQSVNDLPFAVRIMVKRQAAQSQGENPFVRGVNAGPKNYLIADGITDVKEAASIVLHEVVGHKAVLGMLGKEGDSIMERIAYSYGPKQLQDLIKAYGADFKTKEGRILLGKEKVAQMAESGEKPSMLGKLVATVKGWLRKVFPGIKWSDNDVLNMLAKARDNAESGKMMKVDPSKEADANQKDDVNLSIKDSKGSVKQEGKETPYDTLFRTLGQKDKTVFEKARDEMKRQFKSGGMLPDSVFSEKIARDSGVNASELEIGAHLSTLRAAVKKAYGKEYSSLSSELKKKINDQMGSTEPDASIPFGIRMELMKMRFSIKGLSQEYASILSQDIEKLKADGNNAEAQEKARLLETIQENLETYTNRSYKAFDDPNWPKKIPKEVVDAAKAYLEQRYEGEGMTDREIQVAVSRTIREIVEEGTAYQDLGSFIKESKLGAKDLSTLKRRKEIAPEIRALLGEYEDVEVNFAKTVTKTSRLVANHKFLERVLEIGVEEGFLFTNDTKPLDKSVVKIAADGSEVMAPLNGYYTFPEIDQAFREALGRQGDMPSWLSAVIRMNGLVKYGKTVLSPTTAMRNVMSAFFFSVANGHFDMSHMKKSIAIRKQYFGNDSDRTKLEYLKKLKTLGVIYDTPYAGEMMDLLHDSQVEDLMTNKKVFSSFTKASNFAQKFYQYGDDMWKIVGWENEKALMMKYKNMSEAEAEAAAAERIRNTYPTYSMTGRFTQSLRRFPLAGTFVSFPAEIIRTSYHMIRYLKQDFADSPAYARRKVAGLAMVSGLAFAAQALSKAMMGLDDDEEEAVRDMAAPWQKNSNILFAGRDEKGNIQYLDMSFLDPYGYFKRPINALLRDQPVKDATTQAVSEMLSPFFGEDMTFATISEVYSNKKASGGKVFNEESPGLKQAADIANHIRKGLQPGFMSNIERIFKAMNGDLSISGKKYTMKDEMAALVGFRMSTLDPKTSLYYQSFSFRQSKTDANKILKDVLRNPNKVSKRDLEYARDALEKARKDAYTRMSRIVSAAQKSGMPRKEVIKVLRLSGLSRSDIMTLTSGRAPTNDSYAKMALAISRRAAVLYGKEYGEEILNRSKGL